MLGQALGDSWHPRTRSWHPSPQDTPALAVFSAPLPAARGDLSISRAWHCHTPNAAWPLLLADGHVHLARGVLVADAAAGLLCRVVQ